MDEIAEMSWEASGFAQVVGRSTAWTAEGAREWQLVAGERHDPLKTVAPARQLTVLYLAGMKRSGRGAEFEFVVDARKVWHFLV